MIEQEFESILNEYTKGEDPVEDSSLMNKSNQETKKIIAEFQTKAKGSPSLIQKNTKDLTRNLNYVYKDAKNKNETKIIKYEDKKKRLLEEAVNVFLLLFITSIGLQ